VNDLVGHLYSTRLLTNHADEILRANSTAFNQMMVMIYLARSEMWDVSLRRALVKEFILT